MAERCPAFRAIAGGTADPTASLAANVVGYDRGVEYRISYFTGSAGLLNKDRTFTLLIAELSLLA